MQKEVLEKGRLLNWFGDLLEPGYSKKMIRDYHKEDVKASKLRLKEWDYYLIYNDDYGVALTVADNGYMGMLSASVLKFKEKTEKTTSAMTFMPLGKFNMPTTSSKGDVYLKNKRVEASFKHIPGGREIKFTMKNFENKKPLKVDLILLDEPEESVVVYTPFNKKKHFYYNQKIVGFKAKGNVCVGDEIIHFKEKDSVGLLDWGRGVWTYKNTWYWGAASGYVDGKKVGFNIGYGFGNTENATENMLFYEGKAHKINDIKFDIPQKDGKDDFLSPWTIKSDDWRCNLSFTPIINRKAYISVGVICSDQNQVFGKFSGRIVLDDGKQIFIKDMMGFAEKVYNRW